ncbi:cytochrome b5-like isoform X2 [Colletes gigas]|uniref:cytochrome b5-like isoform X2 n=1 Tax=Colletes gigas TaxID=935657 RepID=UPI001C9AEE9B|nr:cytochrome b5-like isoform X2 [Colletes gigas]
MEENRADQSKVKASESGSSEMDLLSLTIRSLDLRSLTPQSDGFLNLEKDSVSEEELRTAEKEKSKGFRTISLDEVAWHDTADNCWVVIYDFVYDCTDFLRNHPGGSDVILEYAGRDATLAFIGTGHSRAAKRSLERLRIGELPPEERIFRVPDGVKVPEF